MEPDVGHYLEKWGMRFEHLGGTRMMGRVLGWLLICDPPHQTAKEVAKALGVSIGSISITTRGLEQFGMIERIGIPGERSAHFRIAPGVWVRMMRIRLDHLNGMRELAEEGMGLFPGRHRKVTRRLREIRDYCAFMSEEIPPLLEQWERRWQGEESS